MVVVRVVFVTLFVSTRTVTASIDIVPVADAVAVRIKLSSVHKIP